MKCPPRPNHLAASTRPEFGHAQTVAKIHFFLRNFLPGKGAVTELEVLTDSGVKIPDLLWLDPIRIQDRKIKKPIHPAPELCIEVCSPSNRDEELSRKRDAYLRAGAREIWICARDGEITFFNANGQIEQSQICPNCPGTIREIEAINDSSRPE